MFTLITIKTAQRIGGKQIVQLKNSEIKCCRPTGTHATETRKEVWKQHPEITTRGVKNMAKRQNKC